MRNASSPRGKKKLSSRHETAKMSSKRGRTTGHFDRDEEDDSSRKFGTAVKSLPNVASISNSPSLSVLAYCGSSILMTVMNKYILSGLDFNLNFLLLCVQV